MGNHRARSVLLSHQTGKYFMHDFLQEFGVIKVEDKAVLQDTNFPSQYQSLFFIQFINVFPKSYKLVMFPLRSHITNFWLNQYGWSSLFCSLMCGTVWRSHGTKEAEIVYLYKTCGSRMLIGGDVGERRAGYRCRIGCYSSTVPGSLECTIEGITLYHE